MCFTTPCLRLWDFICSCSVFHSVLVGNWLHRRLDCQFWDSDGNGWISPETNWSLPALSFTWKCLSLWTIHYFTLHLSKSFSDWKIGGKNCQINSLSVFNSLLCAGVMVAVVSALCCVVTAECAPQSCASLQTLAPQTNSWQHAFFFLFSFFAKAERKKRFFNRAEQKKLIDICYSLVPGRLLHLHPVCENHRERSEAAFPLTSSRERRRSCVDRQTGFYGAEPPRRPLSGPRNCIFLSGSIHEFCFRPSHLQWHAEKTWEVLYCAAICTYIIELCIADRELVVERAKDICVGQTGEGGQLSLPSRITNSLLYIRKKLWIIPESKIAPKRDTEVVTSARSLTGKEFLCGWIKKKNTQKIQLETKKQTRQIQYLLSRCSETSTDLFFFF